MQPVSFVVRILFLLVLLQPRISSAGLPEGMYRNPKVMEATRMLSVNISKEDIDPGKVQDSLNSIIAEVLAVIAESGIVWSTHESSTYQGSFGACSDGTRCYKIRGNVAFVLIPENKEQALMNRLEEKGFSATLGQYYFGQCCPAQ